MSYFQTFLDSKNNRLATAELIKYVKKHTRDVQNMSDDNLIQNCVLAWRDMKRDGISPVLSITYMFDPELIAKGEDEKEKAIATVIAQHFVLNT